MAIDPQSVHINRVPIYIHSNDAHFGMNCPEGNKLVGLLW